MKQDYCSYADVFFGSEEPSLPVPAGIAAKWFFIKAQAGNCHPGAAVPFSMVTACAYTGGYSNGYSHYWTNSNCRPPKIMPEDKKYCYGVSHFHQSGTGYIDEFYNYFIVTPYSCKVPKRYDTFPLTNEDAYPGYYGCCIGDIKTKLTVTGKAAAESYEFLSDNCGIVFDAFLNGMVKNKKILASGGRLDKLTLRSDGFDCEVKYASRLYASVYCGNATEIAKKGNRIDMRISGKKATVYIGFSFHSAENAQINRLEAQKKSFEDISEAAQKRWNERFSSVEIEAPENIKKTFYSCFYQSLIKPVNIGKDSPHYSTDNTYIEMLDYNTMWDMYKTQLPFLFMMYKDIAEKAVSSMVKCIDVFGLMPICLMLTPVDEKCDSQARALFCYSLTDAFLYGAVDDPENILEAMIKELKRAKNKRFFKRGTADEYPSHTIDLACACYCVFLIAQKLGKKELAEEYLGYSRYWKNAYDENTGLCPKNGSYYEGCEWNYSFRLLPFMRERISLCENYVDMLDRFFGYDKIDAVQYVNPNERQVLYEGEARQGFEGFNNETDMETPYAYIYAGRIDRTAEIVRGGMKYMYGEGRGGLCGNNDSGGLTSVYLYNALGIFPVSGQPLFLLDSPSIDKAEISLANGKTLVIIAENNSETNIYPQKILFNGKLLDRLYLTTDEIMGGGELIFKMGNTPKAMKFGEIHA